VGKTFVGIGFGPIQGGLFLLEAQASGNFERLVVAEVMPELVAAVCQSGGRIRVNVARPHDIQTYELQGLEIYNPNVADDAARLIEAIAAADEIATALPSVDFYIRGAPCPAEILAYGLERKLTDRNLPLAVVYAAENHNHAAEKLRDAVLAAIEPSKRSQLDNRVQFVNTVIGKMSGIVSDRTQIERDGLAALVDGGNHAVLVEQFNSILISEITLAGFARGIEVFQEKHALVPFEEAKLYGHNAAHALLGYLANRAGCIFMCEAETDLRRLVEGAFLDESGGALCRRHAGVDSLFTQTGWAGYVEDLMDRMVNPLLRDRVDRIVRDPRRKLAWDDRLVGTMRLAIDNDIVPRRYAMGAAAAAEMLLTEQSEETIASLFGNIWGEAADSSHHRDSIINYIQQAHDALRSPTDR
jgi:mannitol-1-phosphate 5-dehydrogenase